MKQDERHQPLNGTQWTNTDLVGTVDGQSMFRLQDDFHAAVNRNWLAHARIRPGNSSESSFWEQMRAVEERVRELLTGPADPDLPCESDLTQRLYRAFMDMDARDSRGFAPVMPFVEQIRSVSDLDDLTALLSGDAHLFTSVFAAVEVFADKKDSANNVVYLNHASFTLSDPDEYRAMSDQGHRMKAADDAYFSWLLERAGFAEDDAHSMVERSFALEAALAQSCFGMADRARDDYEEITYHVRTLDELESEAGSFPLAAVLAAQGLDGSRKFVLEEPDWFAALAGLYTSDHVEDFKAWMSIRTLRSFAGLLDREALDRSDRWSRERMGSVGAKPLERKAFDTVNGLLGMALGRRYAARFLPPEAKADVEALVGETVRTYRNRLDKAEWLGAATRERAKEKLDALTVRVGYPSSWPDYTRVSVPDGANLVQWAVAIDRFETERRADKVNRPVEREEWLMDPHQVNAYYLPTDNSINILAGILGGVFYDPQASREENMGGIGMVIGHEITHAFDKNGSLYDKDGNLGNSWWTDDDRAAFKERTDAVATYWNNIEVLPGLNVDGDLCVGETVADLGGLSCMVQIGRNIPGFDFARMFCAYARDWRLVESREMVEYLLINDVHAPAHLRTNATVVHIPEFADAFSVKPGDGMYLPPEQRLRVW